MSQQHVLRYAGILGFLGVCLGAFGAHALKPTLLATDSLKTWETAVFYHLIHAVGLLALGQSATVRTGVVRSWLAGIFLFSGSLYVLALTQIKILGAVTPFGGVAFLVGWVLLLRAPTKQPSLHS